LKWTRGLVKAIGYRVLSIVIQLLIVGFTVGWVWTPVVFLLNGVLVAVYVLYEKAWDRVVSFVDTGGIRKLYPRIPLSVKLRALAANARPFTLLLPIVGGYLMVQASLGRFELPTPDPFITVGAVASMMLVNAAGNYWNSLADLEIDRINKPYRPLPSGVLSEREVRAAAGLMSILSVVVAWFINPVFFVLALAMMLATMAYSLEPVRLKKRLWLNNGSQALIRGVLGPLAMWSIYAPVGQSVMILASTMFLFIVTAQSIKDIPDMRGDSFFNVRTIPVVYGIDNTKGIILGGYIWTGVLTVLLCMGVGVLVPVLFVPTAFAFVYFTFKPRATITENNLAWNLFYASMLALILGFTLSRVLL
jgi:4-hydroxybenzoate polyprenyltransferase